MTEVNDKIFKIRVRYLYDFRLFHHTHLVLEILVDFHNIKEKELHYK